MNTENNKKYYDVHTFTIWYQWIESVQIDVQKNTEAQKLLTQLIAEGYEIYHSSSFNTQTEAGESFILRKKIVEDTTSGVGISEVRKDLFGHSLLDEEIKTKYYYDKVIRPNAFDFCGIDRPVEKNYKKTERLNKSNKKIKVSKTPRKHKKAI